MFIQYLCINYIGVLLTAWCTQKKEHASSVSNYVLINQQNVSVYVYLGTQV